jgi:hypothetical protein
VTTTGRSWRPLPLMLLGLWACGGISTASGLYSGDGGDDASSAGHDAKTHHKTVDGGTTGSGGGTGGDATSGFDVSTITPPTDAFVGTPDVGVSHDTGTTVNPKPCQSSSDCTTTDPTCCATFDQQGTPTADCVASTAACQGSGGAPIACTASGQCPTNEVCCATTNGFNISEVACAGSCNGYGQVELCDPNAHPSKCAAADEQCMAYGNTGYGYCTGNMGGQGQH